MTVQFDGVAKRFGGHWAVAHVDLTIREGMTVALTGSNGAGKTTLLRLMATAIRPTLGRIALFGRDTRSDGDAVRARLGLLTHKNHLYDDLSGRENLRLIATLTGRSAKDVDAALDRVAMDAAADRPVRTYSAGMKRRIGMARIVLDAPELVLLDEPFGQLDPSGVAAMEEVIRDFKKRGATLVISTHDIARGLSLADHRLRMEGGQPVGALDSVEHDR